MCKVIALLKKNALYLGVNVFRTEVLIGDTIFTSPTGDGTAIVANTSRSWGNAWLKLTKLAHVLCSLVNCGLS